MFTRETTLRIPLIEFIWPEKSLTRDLLLVMGTSLLLALSAQIAIPLPFSPVPVTSQTLVVLLAGAVLGSRLGTLSVLAYLAEGAVGLPFFAKGNAGLGYLRGVTAGYLLGFVVAAYVVGFVVEKGFGHKFSTAILAMVLGNIIIYTFGVWWLATFLPLEKAFMQGTVPFILGDIYKIGAASILFPKLWKFFGKSRDY